MTLVDLSVLDLPFEEQPGPDDFGRAAIDGISRPGLGVRSDFVALNPGTSTPRAHLQSFENLCLRSSLPSQVREVSMWIRTPPHFNVLGVPHDGYLATVFMEAKGAIAS